MLRLQGCELLVLYQVMVIGLVGAEGAAVWHGYASGWVPVVAILSALSMVLGNLVAITQSSVRRLLAYSAIAHTGYMLVGVVHTEQSFIALLYYAITYALTVLGAFGVVSGARGRRVVTRSLTLQVYSQHAPVPSFCHLWCLCCPLHGALRPSRGSSESSICSRLR